MREGKAGIMIFLNERSIYFKETNLKEDAGYIIEVITTHY